MTATTTDSDSALTGDDGRLAALRARLLAPMPDDGRWGWIWPLVITVFGGFLRFSRLRVPRALIFDETYYAKDAWSILQHGVEWRMAVDAHGNDIANQIIQAGGTHIFLQGCNPTPGLSNSCAEYVVQPEVGKLLIAAGEWMFGLNSFGWRFMSAVFGTLAILVICRIARRMFRSTLLGCIAGLLMSLDGMEFVLSRTGILDIFLMFFVLAAFGCLLIDRDVSRERLVALMVSQPIDERGPRLGIRRWRVLAGICLGLAIGTKWDAIWYLFALAGLGTAWDIGARRALGLRSYVAGTFLRDVVWLPLTFIAIPLVTYIATWSNWLLTRTGYDRNWATQNGLNVPVVSALRSLWQYHYEAIEFGLHLRSPHQYQSQPWDWLLLTRPVAFWYYGYQNTVGGPANQCPPKHGCTYSAEVLMQGTPAIWWASMLALLFLLGYWMLQRDWRAGAILLAVCAGWLTWFPFVSRTKFLYYALEFEPYIILALTLCLGLILGRTLAPQWRRALGAGLVGAYLVVVLLMFWYFYPVLAYKIIPYSEWLKHMWYRTGVGWV